MIERPQDYGPQVLMRLQNGLAVPAVSYLEAMRWRGPALAAHLAAVAGVDAVIAPVAPVRRAHHRRERRRQQPRRRSGDPAADPLYPAGQLSRAAVAGDSRQASPRPAFPLECS